jgi:hypothetical protein
MVSQFSRIKFHTTTVGLTFSVPTSEDFTDGSWTDADLCLSEIGVDELRNKAFIRIGDTINEIGLLENQYIISSDTVGTGATTSEQTIYSYTFSTIEVDKGFNFKCALITEGNTNNKTIKVNFGGVNILDTSILVVNPNDARVLVEFDLTRNSTNYGIISGITHITTGTSSTISDVGIGNLGTFSWTGQAVEIKTTTIAANDIELYQTKINLF